MKEHVIDATGKALGRIATEAALILQGKHEPSYEPRLAGTDVVKIVHAASLKFTGSKLTQKRYYRHSTRIGSLKSRTLEQLLERDPREAVRRAVRNMLPKNRLQAKRLRRLKIEA